MIGATGAAGRRIEAAGGRIEAARRRIKTEEKAKFVAVIRGCT